MGLGLSLDIGQMASDLFGLDDSAARMASATREANAAQMGNAYEDRQLQKEFAQHGIQWRVADAVAAGLHPLAALGAAGAAYSPQPIKLDPAVDPGGWRSRMGQNLSRSIHATAEWSTRQLDKLAVERAVLENDLLKVQIEREARRVMQPSFPPAAVNSQIGIEGLNGQADSLPGGSSSNQPPVQFMPMGTTMSPKGRPAQAYGHVPMLSYIKHADGSLEPISSPDIQGNKANDLFEMLSFHINRFAEKYGNPRLMAPSYEDNPLPRDLYWKFRWSTGRYHPTKIKNPKHYGMQKWLKPY